MSADDIVDPPTVVVAGSTYRLRHVAEGIRPDRPRSRADRQGQQQQERQQQAPKQLPAPSSTPEPDDACPMELDVPATPAADFKYEQEGGKYVTKVYVDEPLFPFLIGRQGQNIREMQSSTGCTINIPRTGGPGQQQQQVARGAPNPNIARSHMITLTASDLASLQRGYSLMRRTIKDAVGSRYLDYTHFVSIPLQSQQVAAQLTQLKQQLLSLQPPVPGLEPRLFPSPATLHLTLTMLKLYSDEARQAAATTLASLQPVLQELLRGQPLQLQVAGLGFIGPDPSRAKVVYLDVQEVVPAAAGGQGRLGPLVQYVVGAFKRAGLLQQGDREEVLLHATIINTAFRARSNAAGDRRNGGREERVPVDATSILDQFAGFDAGVVKVPELHVSTRFRYAQDGYYLSLAQVPLVA